MTITKSLKAERREATGKGAARELRRNGRIPAILYGRDMETVHLTVDAMEAEHLFQAISVENTIVALEVEGDKEARQTLVREIQSHPHRHELVHVDFLQIQKGVAVQVEVPVELVGTPAGVKQHGGVLEQVIHELPVRCIPSLIPEIIELDVTGLDIDDSFHVSDMELPEGVTVTIDPERTVCVVAPPRAVVEEEEEEEEEALEPGEAPEPEVIGEEEEAPEED
ncbi:MAG: 50S ribosomal protein L25/general stress protein Ctc [Gemmatimonadota bacterium]|jgi:large subunit ribosomal protein L25